KASGPALRVGIVDWQSVPACACVCERTRLGRAIRVGWARARADDEETLGDAGVARVSAGLVKTKTPGVYRRGGRYVASWRDNQGRQRTRSAATLTEAKAVRAANLADVIRGEYRAVSTVSFRAYAPEWYAGYKGRTSRGLREA